MKKLNRREFVTRSIAGAGALWAGLGANPSIDMEAFARAKKQASDLVPLGQTGIRISRLAMGSGTHGVNNASDQTRLGMKGFNDLFQHGFDQGVRFFETADSYGAHPYVKEVLKAVGRDKVVVLTKSHARSAEKMKADLDRFRRELGTDHIDIVLLHYTTNSRWAQDRAGAMDALEEARQQGIIRAHGVSCHDLGALQVASKTPWAQVILARINYMRGDLKQARMDADPETIQAVLTEIKKAGKGVIGMKIFAEGNLSHEPERAIEFATRLSCLDAFTIGFTNPAQIDQVVRKMPTVKL